MTTSQGPFSPLNYNNLDIGSTYMIKNRKGPGNGTVESRLTFRGTLIQKFTEPTDGTLYAVFNQITIYGKPPLPANITRSVADRDVYFYLLPAAGAAGASGGRRRKRVTRSNRKNRKNKKTRNSCK